MFGKLVAMLAQAKGAAVATVFVAGGMTATVAVSNSPEAQQTITNVTESVSNTVSAVTNVKGKPCVGNPDGGQPVVVAQRNAADKLLRDAWNEDHKKLNGLRQSTDADNKAKNDLVKTYQDKLKDRLDSALVQVALLTFGREGRVETDDPTVTAQQSNSPKPSCSPKPSGSPSPVVAATPASASPNASASPDRGRVAVANRTTLTADLRTVVDEAVKDMDDLVKEASDKAAALPASEKGKPEDQEKGKPEDKGKPSDKPGNGNGNGNKPNSSPRP